MGNSDFMVSGPLLCWDAELVHILGSRGRSPLSIASGLHPPGTLSNGPFPSCVWASPLKSWLGDMGMFRAGPHGCLP